MNIERDRSDEVRGELKESPTEWDRGGEKGRKRSRRMGGFVGEMF